MLCPSCLHHQYLFFLGPRGGGKQFYSFEIPSPNQEPNHWKAKGWLLNRTLRNRPPGFCPPASTRRGDGKIPLATALATIPIHSSKPHPQQIPHCLFKNPNLEDGNIIRKIHYQKRFFFFLFCCCCWYRSLNPGPYKLSVLPLCNTSGPRVFIDCPFFAFFCFLKQSFFV